MRSQRVGLDWAHHSLHTCIHRHIAMSVVFPFFGLCRVACGILVPQPGIEPMYPALDEWGLNHWTTREVPTCFSFLFSLGINFLSFGYFSDLISFSDYHVFLKGKILDCMLGGKESCIKRTHSLSFWSWKIIENFRARETLREASVQFSLVAQSCPTLWPHESQHARPPCPSPTPRVYLNSCALSRWCHPAILTSVIPFSCPQSFPASGSFQMSQFFASGGQSIGVSASASVLPMNTQDT